MPGLTIPFIIAATTGPLTDQAGKRQISGVHYAQKVSNHFSSVLRILGYSPPRLSCGWCFMRTLRVDDDGSCLEVLLPNDSVGVELSLYGPYLF